MSSTDSHRRAVSITAEGRRLAAFVDPAVSAAETVELRIAPVGTPIDPT